MRIFLDESKKIDGWKKWQFIFWWLVTTYKPSTIDKIYLEFLESIWFKNKWKELKSTDRYYKNQINDFYNFLDDKWYMENIELCWIYIEEYRENWENYTEMLSILTEFIIENNKFKDYWLSKIQIIADNLKLNKNQRDIEIWLNNELEQLLIESKIKSLWFKFFNSKKFWWLQFADFVAWILKRKYIDNKEELDYDFIEHLVNKEVNFKQIKKRVFSGFIDYRITL